MLKRAKERQREIDVPASRLGVQERAGRALQRDGERFEAEPRRASPSTILAARRLLSRSSGREVKPESVAYRAPGGGRRDESGFSEDLLAGIDSATETIGR